MRPHKHLLSQTQESSLSSCTMPLANDLCKKSGLLAPVIVRAKMLLQRIWTSKIDWDESLPIDLHTEWDKYYSQLPVLNNIRFQRKAIIKSATEIELHGFCDASEKAYGACVYLRTLNSNGRVWIQLLTAKSKVAPLKYHAIPRPELSGALLLTSLMSTIQQALLHKITRTVYWTDSTIVVTPRNTSAFHPARRDSQRSTCRPSNPPQA